MRFGWFMHHSNFHICSVEDVHLGVVLAVDISMMDSQEPHRYGRCRGSLSLRKSQIFGEIRHKQLSHDWL
jgi:hypothetical protein